MFVWDVLQLASRSVSAATVWFFSFAAALPDMMPVILTFFALYTIVRVLISPLVGSAGSDAVKGIRKKYGKKYGKTYSKKGKSNG